MNFLFNFLALVEKFGKRIYWSTDSRTRRSPQGSDQLGKRPGKWPWKTFRTRKKFGNRKLLACWKPDYELKSSKTTRKNLLELERTFIKTHTGLSVRYARKIAVCGTCATNRGCTGRFAGNDLLQVLYYMNVLARNSGFGCLKRRQAV